MKAGCVRWFSQQSFASVSSCISFKMQRYIVVVVAAFLLPLLQWIISVAAAVECDANFWPSELSKMNAYVDNASPPCDDFYEHACGYWRVPYKLRALQARDTLTSLKAGNKEMLIDFFEQHWVAANRSSLLLNAARRAAINFYESCLDDKTSESKSGKQSLQVYRELLLGISDWPVLNADFTENNANESFNWQHVSAQLRRYGVQSFWRLLVQPNWQSADQLILYLMPPQPDLMPGSAAAADSDDDERFLYTRYIKYLMLDLKVRVRTAARIAEEVFDFEVGLRALSSNERDVLLREPQTLASLQRELPEVNLSKYFSSLFADEAAQLPPDYAEHLLIVADRPYLKRLANFLSRAKEETIGKYLLVQVLAHFEVHLHEHELYNEQKQECLLQLHKLMPQQLTKLYLELQHEDSEAFLQRTQLELTSVFDQLKRQFERMLNATNIFDRDAVTKVLGLEKLRAMRLLLPSTQHVDSFRAFEMTQDYHRNLLQLGKLHAANELASIVQSLQSHATGDKAASKPVETQYGPLDVNAYYRLKKNAIELPVGILRAPIYDRCLAPAKTYGSLVYILAHELLHGFDYDGINYDKSGNVGNATNAWGPKAIIQFGSKSSCYMAPRYPNAPLNINENIADSEGLRLALETFVESSGYEEKQRTEQLQLFFTSFAQTWCGREAGRTGSLHASHKERVNNAVKNFEEFAEAFKCRKESAMHPVEKCRIW